MPTQDPSQAQEPAIEVTDLRMDYGGVQALRGVSFAIPRGALCGLVGPNGAGKTTLLSLLAGLEDPTSGRMAIANTSGRSARVGFVPDVTPFYTDLTVKEYLEFFGRAQGLSGAILARRLAWVVDFAGLHDLKDHGTAALSRGMSQRVSVARALVDEPQVLLLDEPASGLDPKARMQLKQLLKALTKRGVTVVISSHILTELGDICDRIVMLQKGRVSADGKIADLWSQAQEDWDNDGRAPSRKVIFQIVLDAESALPIVEAANGTEEVHLDGDLLVARISDPTFNTPPIVRALVCAGFDLGRVEPERENLEALFLSIENQAHPRAAPNESRP